MPSEPMPTDPPPSASPSPATPAPPMAAPMRDYSTTEYAQKIVVYRHSNLFYWWPVWLLGFVFALITYVDDYHLAIVPTGTKAVEKQEIDIDRKGKKEVHDILVLDAKHHHIKKENDDQKL